MDLFSMFKGEFLRQKLLQAGISPNDLQGIDFNNVNDLNSLAEKQKEVCEVIDMN